jgi:hypothetical protein
MESSNNILGNGAKDISFDTVLDAGKSCAAIRRSLNFMAAGHAGESCTMPRAHLDMTSA